MKNDKDDQNTRNKYTSTLNELTEEELKQYEKDGEKYYRGEIY